MAMASVASPRLTEAALLEALQDAPQASVLVVGKQARFAAQRMILSVNASPELKDLLKIHVDPDRDDDAWELF